MGVPDAALEPIEDWASKHPEASAGKRLLPVVSYEEVPLDKRSCSGCLDRCMDMDMDPYCTAVNLPWGKVLTRGRPEECGEQYLLWQKDIRSLR